MRVVHGFSDGCSGSRSTAMVTTLENMSRPRAIFSSICGNVTCATTILLRDSEQRGSNPERCAAKGSQRRIRRPRDVRAYSIEAAEHNEFRRSGAVLDRQHPVVV